MNYKICLMVLGLVFSGMASNSASADSPIDPYRQYRLAFQRETPNRSKDSYQRVYNYLHQEIVRGIDSCTVSVGAPELQPILTIPQYTSVDTVKFTPMVVRPYYVSISFAELKGVGEISLSCHVDRQIVTLERINKILGDEFKLICLNPAN